VPGLYGGAGGEVAMQLGGAGPSRRTWKAVAAGRRFGCPLSADPGSIRVRSLLPPADPSSPVIGRARFVDYDGASGWWGE
jgi:hypothetical protein